MKSKNWKDTDCIYSLLERISVDFLKIFGFYFWPRPSFENFLGHYPFFRESIFRISIFQFSNDLILNLRIINFRSSKTFWLIEFPRFRILKIFFLIFGEYNWPLNFAQNPYSCVTSSTFRHEQTWAKPTTARCKKITTASRPL